MYQVKCIAKIQAKNKHVEGYILIDKNKNEMTVEPDELKEAIRSGRIEVTNLTLTSDNRLMVNRQATSSKSKTLDIERLLNRLKTLGYTINTFNAACGHKCYIASSTNQLRHMFIIPDDVKYIYKYPDKDIYSSELYDYMAHIRGMLKVIGGKGLISTQYMFLDCKVKYLDLASLNTRNITDMSSMFHGCEAQYIDLSSFNTSKATDMSSMFRGCKTQSLDLSSFDTSNVTDMNSMFNYCKAQFIDLSSFDTSNVTNMCCMFDGCKAHSIDLSSFNTRNVTTMESMFNECKVRSIDLSSFNTSNATNMGWMFNNCETQYLDLTSFDTSNVADMDFMFRCCEAQINVTDSKLKAQLQHDRR